MSDDWSEGYVTEIDYTWGFHRELSPANLAWVAALRGASPPPLDGPFSYCELGCGNALSLNVFAAAHPDASFFGVSPSEAPCPGRFGAIRKARASSVASTPARGATTRWRPGTAGSAA